MIVLPKLWVPDTRPSAIESNGPMRFRPAGERPSSIWTISSRFPRALRRRQGGYIINPYVFAAAAFKVDAADFDGTNDYVDNNNITAPANAKTGLFSTWIYVDAIDGSWGWTIIKLWREIAGPGYNINLDIQINTSGLFDLSGYDATGTSNYVTIRSTSAIGTGAWHHILCAFDVNSAVRQLYVDGSSAIGTNTSTNTAISYSTAKHWFTGAYHDFFGAIGISDGGLAETYFAAGQYLDISSSTNREKFRSSAGKPVDLGSTGQTPTGSTPSVFLHLDDGESANNFAANVGTIGTGTVNGSLTTRGSSPSD